MFRCLAPEQLDELLDGRMESADEETGLTHLDSCAHCQRQFLELAKQPDVEEWRLAALGSPEADESTREFLDGLKRIAPRQGDRPAVAAPPTPFVSADDRAPPVPGFEILGELGRGGMGVVYKARHVVQNRVVALKMILAGRQASAEDLGRFRDEVEAVSRLRHPHIVQIFDVGQVEGRLYFVLELIEGGTLADRLRGAALAARPAAQLLEALARAMHHAHQRGIIHRDLKPANIMLHGRRAVSELADDAARQSHEWDFRRARPKITDFGLAKLLDRAGQGGHTASGEVVGTPSYMAPEQAMGKSSAIGPGTDVYSLGAILYETITGRPPFQGATMMDTLVLVHTREPMPPRRIRRDIPRDLEIICLKCLRKDPAKRYATAEELAEDLRLFLDGQQIRTHGMRPAWMDALPARFSGWLVMALVFILAIVVGGSLAVLWMRGERQVGQIQVARDENLVATRDNLKLRLQLSHAEAERGEVARGLHEMAAVLELAERQPELEDLRDAARLELAAWNRALSPLRWRSPESLAAAVFTADGREVLAVGANRRLLRWPVGAAPRGADLPDSSGATSIALAPDGSSLAAITPAGLRWWELGDGRIRASVPNLADGRAPIISTDGSSLAVFARWKVPALWLVRQRRGERDTHIEKLTEQAVAWSWRPGGSELLVADENGGLLLHQTGEKRSERSIAVLPAAVTGLAWMNDGSIAIAACDDGVVRFVSVEGTSLVPPLRAHGAGRMRLAANSDGLLLTAGGDRQVKLWRIATGALLATLPHAATIELVEFARDGRSFLTRDERGNTVVWDIPSFDWEWNFGAAAMQRPTLRSDGLALGVLRGGSPSRLIIRELTPPSSEAMIDPEAGQQFHFGAFAPNDGMLVVGARFTDRHDVLLFDANRRLLGKPMSLNGGELSAIAFSPDGNVMLAGTGIGEAILWDWKRSQRREPPLLHAGKVLAARFREDGKAVALAGHDARERGEARIWSPITGEPMSPPLAHPAPVIAVAWEVSGTTIQTTDVRGEVRRWDIASGQRLDPPAPVPTDATIVACDSSGQRLVYRTDGEANRLLVPDRPPILLESSLALWHAAFSPDARLLATACADGVRLFDVQTGLPLGPVHGPVGAAGLEFLSDGRLLAWSATSVRVIERPRAEFDAAEWRDRLRRMTGMIRMPDGELRPVDPRSASAGTMP